MGIAQTPGKRLTIALSHQELGQSESPQLTGGKPQSLLQGDVRGEDAERLGIGNERRVRRVLEHGVDC